MESVQLDDVQLLLTQWYGLLRTYLSNTPADRALFYVVLSFLSWCWLLHVRFCTKSLQAINQLADSANKQTGVVLAQLLDYQKVATKALTDQHAAAMVTSRAVVETVQAVVESTQG